MKESLTQFRIVKDYLTSRILTVTSAKTLGLSGWACAFALPITDPGSYQDLIYSKGGYVLQMLRAKMWIRAIQIPTRIQGNHAGLLQDL